LDVDEAVHLGDGVEDTAAHHVEVFELGTKLVLVCEVAFEDLDHEEDTVEAATEVVGEEGEVLGVVGAGEVGLLLSVLFVSGAGAVEEREHLADAGVSNSSGEGVVSTAGEQGVMNALASVDDLD
jgi:hypothetical protein